MKHLKYQTLVGNFPHGDFRPNQRESLRVISQEGDVLLELPSGTGKTAVGIAYLKAMSESHRGSFFYVTPTKTLVDQVKRLHPEVGVLYGRNEYPCRYYGGAHSAEDVPCGLLDCEFRTGGCPYYDAKRAATASAGLTACTTAFYIFQAVFLREKPGENFQRPYFTVLDEVHRTADVVRSCLSWEITDYHLGRVLKLLHGVDMDAHRRLELFRGEMARVVRVKPSKELLSDAEIGRLVQLLMDIDTERMERLLRRAVRVGVYDPKEDREDLNVLYRLGKAVGRNITEMERARGKDPLNYVYGFVEKNPQARSRYKLRLRHYSVGARVRDKLLKRGVGYSATIGKERPFRAENGIEFPIRRFPSPFKVERTRLYLPTDTPNLAVRARLPGDVVRSYGLIASACQAFLKEGHRCLVITIADRERAEFIDRHGAELDALSYGNGTTAKEAASRFLGGEGGVLVGTAANYAEGLDLPHQAAPAIFFLRPGYPKPGEPRTAFEERRFGSDRWAQWNWRVGVQALQVRGRNIRSAEDLGVCFFMSQQFNRALSPPKWLEEALVKKPFGESVDDALEVLEDA